VTLAYSGAGLKKGTAPLSRIVSAVGGANVALLTGTVPFFRLFCDIVGWVEQSEAMLRRISVKVLKLVCE